jgi:predicted nuclease of restriction endonuclease-like RecB superfamily
VVGFWTPDYLERKLSQLDTIRDAPVVVCVDETLACDPSRLAVADVVRFRQRLEPAVLLAAAERAASVWRQRRPRNTLHPSKHNDNDRIERET